MKLSVGFAKRVLERLMTIPPSTKICLYSPPKRTQSAWVGGCLLATLSPFKNMWIMKEEYEEEGVNCVHKKCWMLFVCWRIGVAAWSCQKSGL